MNLTDDEMADIVRDRQRPPNQSLKDTMIALGITPERFTDSERAEIHRRVVSTITDGQ